MRKHKKRRGITVVIVLLVTLLIAVIALIIWKQWEYNASEEFYKGLRGAIQFEEEQL